MATTYHITEQDKYTVAELDRALAVCQKKIDDEYLSEKTKKKVQKLHDKYTHQKAKTIRLYEKKRKKSPSLKGISVSALSVKKILEIAERDKGKDPDFIEHGKAWDFFLGNKAENLCAIVGGGLAVVGILSSPAGQEMMSTALKQFGNWASNTFLKQGAFMGLNWSAVALTAGISLFAGAMIKKGIRKSMEATAIQRYEAEEAMNKGTARDHKYILSNQKDLINEAAAGKEIDNTTYQYLLSVATNSNNTPNVVAAAREILKEASKERAANQTQIENALFEANLTNNTRKPKLNARRKQEKDAKGNLASLPSIKERIVRQIKLEQIQELQSKTKGCSKDDFVSKYSLTLDGDDHSYDAVWEKIVNASTSDDEKQKVIAGKMTEDQFLETVLGTKSETGYDPSKENAAKAVYAKIQAENELSQKRDRGEYNVTGTGKIELTENGHTYDEDTVQADADNALIEAAKASGIPVGSTSSDAERKAEADKLRIKYATQLNKINNDLTAELEAGRTGSVKIIGE